MPTRVDRARFSRIARRLVARIANIVRTRSIRGGKLASEADEIRHLFDRVWYLSQNPDVAEAKADPVKHYLAHGALEGRRPNVIFDPLWYKEHNPDVLHYPRDPLVHFALHGRFEGRRPSSEFDPLIYQGLYPDIAAEGIDPTEHYVRYGRTEGRAISNSIPTVRHGASAMAIAQGLVPKEHTPSIPWVPPSMMEGQDFVRNPQITTQHWRFREAGAPTGSSDILSMQLKRALRELRLDIAGSERRQPIIQALVSTSTADVRSREPIDIVIGNILEEDGVLSESLEIFNQSAAAVICSTSHGRNSLINSGLAIPSAAIGVGVDHWDQVVSSGAYEYLSRRFRFLHVISAGGGEAAEVVLKAFSNVFDRNDEVSLVLVATSGEHRDRIRNRLMRLQKGDTNFPDVILIEEQVADADLKSIYQSCHIYLAANHTRGFNLSIAYGILCGLPPVVIGYGGHMDYCNDENAWLVDFDFIRVRNSISSHDAFAPQINLAALESMLWRAYQSTPEERFHRAWSGRKKLMSNFTWKDVALRLARFASRSETLVKPVGWLTTWNVQCGIGIYVEHMLATRVTREHIIFAGRQEPRTRADGDNVARVWDVNKSYNSFDEFYVALASKPCDVVIIQFNYGFFNHSDLGKLIEDLIRRGIVVFVDLHSTIDMGVPNYQLIDILPALKKAHRVMIHNASDWPRMKKMGLLDNTLFSPLGVLRRPKRTRKLVPGVTPIITSFGFCFEGKGLVELVHAVAVLRERGQRVYLRMLNAEYSPPHPMSTVVAIRAAIDHFNLQDCIEFRTEYLDDETCLNLIAEADLFINPYKSTNESASAATRYGLATGVPVAVTPLPIFDDLGDAVFKTAGVTPDDLADGIASVLENIANETPLARRVAAAAKVWRREHDYALLGARVEQIARALVPNSLPVVKGRASLGNIYDSVES